MPDITQSEPATNQELQKIVVLLGALLTKDTESQGAKVKILAPLGLTTAQMAAACATTPKSVRARVAEIKQSKGKKE